MSRFKWGSLREIAPSVHTSYQAPVVHGNSLVPGYFRVEWPAGSIGVADCGHKHRSHSTADRCRKDLIGVAS